MPRRFVSLSALLTLTLLAACAPTAPLPTAAPTLTSTPAYTLTASAQVSLTPQTTATASPQPTETESPIFETTTAAATWVESLTTPDLTSSVTLTTKGGTYSYSLSIDKNGPIGTFKMDADTQTVVGLYALGRLGWRVADQTGDPKYADFKAAFPVAQGIKVDNMQRFVANRKEPFTAHIFGKNDGYEYTDVNGGLNQDQTITGLSVIWVTSKDFETMKTKIANLPYRLISNKEQVNGDQTVPAGQHQELGSTIESV